MGEARSILIVDDDQDFLEALGMLLGQLGHDNVQTAINGVEALDRLEESPGAFGLMLTDYMMPEMDGITLIEELNGVDDFKDMPKAIVSGYGTPEVVDMAASLGVMDWFDKPIDHDKLQALLDSIWDN